MKKLIRVFFLMSCITCIPLSGCTSQDDGTQEKDSSKSVAAKNKETNKTTRTKESTEDTQESKKEMHNNKEAFTSDSLRNLLFPEGKGTFWSTKDDSLVVIFSDGANEMSLSHFGAPNSYALIRLPSELTLDNAGDSFTISIDKDHAIGSFYETSSKKLTIHVGKEKYAYYLDFIPLAYSYHENKSELTRFYLNSWESKEEAVEVLKKVMANPNNAMYFGNGIVAPNFRENTNLNSTIEIFGVNEQGEGGGGGGYKLQKSAETYTITRISGGDIPTDEYLISRDSYDVLEAKKLDTKEPTIETGTTATNFPINIKEWHYTTLTDVEHLKVSDGKIYINDQEYTCDPDYSTEAVQNNMGEALEDYHGTAKSASGETVYWRLHNTGVHSELEFNGEFYIP